MEPVQLQRMFQHIADYYRGRRSRMDFVWHGGEPLLIDPSYYRAIQTLQHQAFDGSDVSFTNSVQTNLVVLTDEILDLLRRFFTHVGVSLDLFGDLRVNVAGKSSQPRVLSNMQRLLDEGVTFGCITVLSKLTAPHVAEIYRFYEEIDTSFRFLPIYRTGYEHQQDDLALTDQEIVAALKRAVELWFASDSDIQVRPIQDFVMNVVRRLDGGTGPRYRYDKLESELVYIVDTDGSLYSNADAYDSNLCHGNIFEQPLRELRRSDNYLNAVRAAHGRMSATCAECRYHGACSGYFMAEATPEQRFTDGQGRLRCAIALPVQKYVEELLTRYGVVDQEAELLLEDRLKSKLEGAPSDFFLD